MIEVQGLLLSRALTFAFFAFFGRIFVPLEILNQKNAKVFSAKSVPKIGKRVF